MVEWLCLCLRVYVCLCVRLWVCAYVLVCVMLFIWGNVCVFVCVYVHVLVCALRPLVYSSIFILRIVGETRGTEGDRGWRERERATAKSRK